MSEKTTRWQNKFTWNTISHWSTPEYTRTIFGNSKYKFQKCQLCKAKLIRSIFPKIVLEWSLVPALLDVSEYCFTNHCKLLKTPIMWFKSCVTTDYDYNPKGFFRLWEEANKILVYQNLKLFNWRPFHLENISLLKEICQRNYSLARKKQWPQNVFKQLIPNNLNTSKSPPICEIK